MKKWIITVSGFLVALAVVFGVSSRGAAVQRVPDGAFLQAADGTIYAVSGGVRFRIQPSPDTGGVLAGFRDGPAVSDVSELNFALAAVAPLASTSDPASTLAGQGVSTCAGEGRWDAEVVRGQWVKSIGGAEAPADAMWAVAVVLITNTGAAPSQEPARGGVKLRDDRDRERLNQVVSPEVEAAIAAELGVDGPAQEYAPGIAVRTFMIWPVAASAQRLSLVPNPSSCVP